MCTGGRELKIIITSPHHRTLAALGTGRECRGCSQIDRETLPEPVRAPPHNFRGGIRGREKVSRQQDTVVVSSSARAIHDGRNSLD